MAWMCCLDWESALCEYYTLHPPHSHRPGSSAKSHSIAVGEVGESEMLGSRSGSPSRESGHMEVGQVLANTHT